MFALFSFDSYYPNGGWHDFKGFFDSKEEAIEHYKNGMFNGNTAHVVNMTTRKIVWENS